MKKFLLGCVVATLLVAMPVLHAQEISTYLYGQNHWMAGSDEQGRPGYLHLLWPRVQQSGVRLIRIGGNGYLRMPDRHRLDGMVDSVRQIGAEPMVQIPGTFTASQTIELVKYYSKQGRVKFWCIGNEPLHKHHNLSIEQVYEYIMRIAPAIRKADENALVFVFDEAEMIDSAYAALCGGHLDVCGKGTNGKWLVDGFTFHNYPNGKDFGRDDVVFSGPRKIERQMVALVAMMEKANKKHRRIGKNRLLWGMTEVNVTYHNPNRDITGFGNPSFLAGQFLAEIYGLGAKYGAFTVAPWCICETDRIQTDFGYLGLPEEFYPRSSYYHTQLMSRYMKGYYIDSETNQGYVKTVASLNNDTLSIMIMNQDDLRGYEYEISSVKKFSTYPLSVFLNTEIKVNYQGVIPEQTTLLLQFSRSGMLTKRYVYGLKENLKNESPRSQP